MGYGIVVDASVARAAGDRSTIARKCRSVLEAVDDGGHRLVMSKPLKDEWFRTRAGGSTPYASRYALSWFWKMTTERRVAWVTVGTDVFVRLRERVLAASERNARMQVSKDFHLVETALASDNRVLSLDNKIRGHLRRAGRMVKALCVILWLNPAREQATDWLVGGAPDVSAYRLCDAGSR